MTIAHLNLNPIFEARSSLPHARALVRSGWRIILGVIVTIGMWMAFAGLCAAIVDDLNANTVGEAMTAPQQSAQITLNAAKP